LISHLCRHPADFRARKFMQPGSFLRILAGFEYLRHPVYSVILRSVHVRIC
jgi:hypothetical protein